MISGLLAFFFPQSICEQEISENVSMNSPHKPFVMAMFVLAYRGTQRENFSKVPEISLSDFLDCFKAF